MIYKNRSEKRAENGLAKLKQNDNGAYKKVSKLLFEIQEHPTIETGKPKQLKHYEIPTWLRCISSKHRLVYQIYEEIITVLTISDYEHYGNK